MNTKKILVTGASGNVGRALMSSLELNTNAEVFYTGRSHFSCNKKFIQADLTTENYIETIKDKLKKCDIIVHLAASINANLQDKYLLDVNCYGTTQIVNLARELGCKKIIYVSSIGVIGKPVEIPITETHSTKPLSLYHCSKLFGEYVVNQSKQYGITPVILRIPSPIGKHMPKNKILPVIIKNCILNQDIILYGSGNRKQNYINVKDVAQGINLAIYNDVEGVFNIASEKSYSNLELANICKKILSSSSKIVYNNTPDIEENFDWTISNEKARVELDFIPEVDLETSILQIKNEINL